MESNGMQLRDEARREPVKNAFRVGWEFVEQNMALGWATVAVFVVLSLVEFVPLVGFAATIAVGVFSQSIQIFVGRAFYGAETMEAFVSEASGVKLSTFLTRYQAPAFGAWLGWAAVGFVMLLAWMALVLLLGGDPAALETAGGDEAFETLFQAMGVAVLPVILIAMLLSYVYPIVQGRVILSDSFGEAFKAVFSLFSPTVWKHAMAGEYFSFVFFFGLVLIGVALAISLVATLLILVPILGALAVAVGAMVLLYPFVAVMGVACVLAREIAEG